MASCWGLFEGAAIVGRIGIKFQRKAELSHLLDDRVEDVLLLRALHNVGRGPRLVGPASS
jgi:hypothetical protein